MLFIYLIILQHLIAIFCQHFLLFETKTFCTRHHKVKMEFVSCQKARTLIIEVEYLLTVVKYLRSKKHVPCFYRVIETQVKVWENEKIMLWEH